MFGFALGSQPEAGNQQKTQLWGRCEMRLASNVIAPLVML